MIKKHYVVTALCIIHAAFGQNSTFQIPDSLQNKDYDYLFDRIEETDDKSNKQSLYLQSFLSKAKSEKKSEEIVNGYKNYLYHSTENLKLIYADSMILAAKRSADNALIGSAYLSKGIVYYGQKKQNAALDYYLTANSYISKTSDNYLIHKVKYHIALIKYYVGYYDEAISLYRQCALYFKEENPRAYLNSLHGLGLSYNKTGDYGLCSQSNALGIAECTRLKIPEMKAYFIHSEGINNYFQHNYGKAIKNIQATLDEIEGNNDFANISVGHFYIGKSYWAQGKKEKAVPYFQKVDRIFNEKGFLRPDLREVYEVLISYYKNRNDPKKQLYYVDQLLKADTLYETNNYLIGKVHKEYDTVVLVAEKEKIQKELLHKENHDLVAAIIILLLCTISAFLLYKHYRNRSFYKKKYSTLMKSINNENQNQPKIKTKKADVSDINANTIATILKQLEKFEKDKKFLKKDWTLVTLSAAFNSNTRYLSNIISHYREKGFVEYINDLRIDYIISLLRSETKYRNYTNNALAEEAGFSSTQRFAFCFKAKTEMPVNFFIEELKKGNL